MIRLITSSKRYLLVWCLIILCATIFLNIRRPLSKYETHEHARLAAGAEESLSNTGCTCNNTRQQPETISTIKPTTYCTMPTREELFASYEANISSIDMQTIEEFVFGNIRGNAELYLDDVSTTMMTSHNGQLTPYYKNHTDFIEAYAKSILIGNYTYYAGGRWRPAYCTPRWKVAIVIPYRDRADHLAILLRNLLHVLTLQNLEFGFFVSEQANDGVFNRGLMKNIGYMESTNFADWDCVIFHDIDQIPMRATNYYGCDQMPRHLCAFAEEMGFKLMYRKLFGGVVGLTAQQMRDSNGYSNVYWGWGAEDDDIRSRLADIKYEIYRASNEGYYRTLKHKKKTAKEVCPERYCILKHFAERVHWDGISNMRYSANVTLNLLFTHIAVDVRKEKWNTYKCKNK